MRIIAGFIIAISLWFPVAIGAIPIDLSTTETVITVPVSSQDNFELFNFAENTLYVLRFDGSLELDHCRDSQIIAGDNNTILIEHEKSLLDATVSITANISANADYVTIHKITVPTNTYPRLDDSIWRKFVDGIRHRVKPREVTARILELSRDRPLRNAIAIGCESGEDPLYFAACGVHVTALDATPHAIGITCLRMAENHLLKYFTDALVVKIENVPTIGPFDAVTAGQVFSFIPPKQFTDVMTQQVLPLVGPEGYFGAHFMGQKHAWSGRSNMTFVDANQLIMLFESNGFDVVEITEINQPMPTVFNGDVWWHEYQVIAKRSATSTADDWTMQITDINSPHKQEIIQQVLELQSTLIVSNQDTEVLPDICRTNGFLTLRWTEDEFAKALQAHGQILTMHHQDRLVGYLILSDSTGYFAWLDQVDRVELTSGQTIDELKSLYEKHSVTILRQIAVARDYAKQGIGRRLVDKAKEICPSGLSTDILFKPFSNHASIAFFAKQGFEHFGTIYLTGKPPKCLPHEIYIDLWLP